VDVRIAVATRIEETRYHMQTTYIYFRQPQYITHAPECYAIIRDPESRPGVHDPEYNALAYYDSLGLRLVSHFTMTHPGSVID
jgi:hypothetical protein